MKKGQFHNQLRAAAGPKNIVVNRIPQFGIDDADPLDICGCNFTMKGQCGQILRPICPNSQEYIALRQLPLLKIHEYRNSFKVKPCQSTRKGFKKNDVYVSSHPRISFQLLQSSNLCCGQVMRQTACCTAGGTLGGLSPPYAQQASCIIQMRPSNRACRENWQYGDAADASSVFLIPEMLAVSAGVGCL